MHRLFNNRSNTERIRLPMEIQRVLDGEIQTLVTEKGFGFIKPAARGADVYFHCSIVDAPFETLAQGQQVKYELDSKADKPRARCVQAGEAFANKRSSRPAARPSTDRQMFENGFVTKLHPKKFRGFISSIVKGPEYLFAAESVTGEKRFSRLEIGDYVQFLVGERDPEYPEQPVAKAVKVVERRVKFPKGKKLDRHPKSRKKKPTWR
jgi:cold shock CspA family protein